MSLFRRGRKWVHRHPALCQPALTPSLCLRLPSRGQREGSTAFLSSGKLGIVFVQRVPKKRRKEEWDGQKGLGRMPSYLVTGGAGFIGSALVRRLLERGERVRVVDNFSTGLRRNLTEVLDGIELLEGDLADFAVARKSVAGVEYVLHQAALPSVPRSIEDPISSNHANVTATLNLLVAARDGPGQAPGGDGRSDGDAHGGGAPDPRGRARGPVAVLQEIHRQVADPAEPALRA